MVFAALSVQNLEPLVGQRAVSSQVHRIGTAADIVCYCSDNNRLVIVELKCGHSGARTAPAIINGKPCKMKFPLSKADDSTLNRHLSQLAVTHHLFKRETQTIRNISNMGIEQVDAILMYANDFGVDVYKMNDWWVTKASKILEKIRY